VQLINIPQTNYSTEHFRTSQSVSTTCGKKESQVKCESKVVPLKALDTAMTSNLLFIT